MSMMNVSDISESLGFKVTKEFIVESLQIEPDGKDKRATLFAQSKFGDIKQALIEHIESCEPAKAEKRPSQAKVSKPAAPESDDEDDY